MPPPPNYRRAFWSSRQHLWLALLTFGLGFASGEPLGLLAGATAYALGLVFLPDSGFFRRAVDARARAEEEAANAEQLAAFRRERDALLNSLSPARRARYNQLAAVCRDIEIATTGAAQVEFATHKSKLEELQWTYLRMLSIEQSIEIFLEAERKEQVPATVAQLDAETRTLATEVEAAKALSPRPPTLDGKERLLTSRLERLAGLQKRLAHIEQAQLNHDLMTSEQQRLVEQVKLIRADAAAARNTDTLISRLDFNIEHLAATNKWLSEISEFKDLSLQVPVPPPPVSPPPPASKLYRPQPEPPASR